MALCKIGKPEEAIVCCNNALNINPIHVKALHTKGIALSDYKKYNEAIECYNIALELNPQNFAIWSNKGNILAKLKKFEDAIKCFEIALKINPDFADGYWNLGATYMSMHRFDKASIEFKKAKEHFQELNLEDKFKEIQKYELWAINTSKLISKLKPIDEKFLNSLQCQNLIELKKKNVKIIKELNKVINEFKNLELPKESRDLLKSKRLCFNALWQSLNFNKVDVNELQETKNIFEKWRLENFVIAGNSLDSFYYIIKNFKSLEEIPQEKEKALINILSPIKLLDGNLTEALSTKIKGKSSNIEPEVLKKEIKVDDNLIEVLSTKIESKTSYIKPKVLKKEIKVKSITLKGIERKNYSRICLVPIDFKTTEVFPYLLRDKKNIKEKILKAIKIAEQNKVDIICFPELCFDKDFIESVKDFRNMIIICGSFYNKHLFNTCFVVYNGQEYPIYKITPATYLEDEIEVGKGMKSGNDIIIFKTEDNDLRFTVLICMDFYSERWRIYDYEFNGKKGVNLIFVPSFNDDNERYQKCADGHCYNYKTDIIKVSNVGNITCVFGRAHRKLIERLKKEKHRQDDIYKYKLCESIGEIMQIIDLYNIPVEVPTPIDSHSRIRIINRYKYEKGNWERIN